MAKAYILVNCELGAEKKVISDLRNIENVKEAHGTLGLYDIVTQIETDKEENIRRIVTGVIRKMPKIHSTMTLMRAEGDSYFASSRVVKDKPSDKYLEKAYVVIHCDKGQEWSILKEIDKLDEVTEADVIFGYYDVICKVVAYSYPDLQNVITRKIRSLTHVRTTMTLNVIPEQ